MDDLDRAFLRLRSLPVPARLAKLETVVMAGIDAERSALALNSRTALSLAALLALGVGMGTTVLPGGSVVAAPGSPLFAGSELAPSTLLASVG